MRIIVRTKQTLRKLKAIRWMTKHEFKGLAFYIPNLDKLCVVIENFANNAYESWKRTFRKYISLESFVVRQLKFLLTHEFIHWGLDEYVVEGVEVTHHYYDEDTIDYVANFVTNITSPEWFDLEIPRDKIPTLGVIDLE